MGYFRKNKYVVAAHFFVFMLCCFMGLFVLYTGINITHIENVGMQERLNFYMGMGIGVSAITLIYIGLQNAVAAINQCFSHSNKRARVMARILFIFTTCLILFLFALLILRSDPLL